MQCPNCGTNEWKSVRVKLQQQYKACSHCGWHSHKDEMKVANEEDARAILDSLYGDLELAHQRFEEADDAYREATGENENPHSIILLAKVRAAHREEEQIRSRVRAVELAIEIATLTEEGAVTLHLPGFIRQFTWGDYDFFNLPIKDD